MAFFYMCHLHLKVDFILKKLYKSFSSNSYSNLKIFCTKNGISDQKINLEIFQICYSQNRDPLKSLITLFHKLILYFKVYQLFVLKYFPIVVSPFIISFTNIFIFILLFKSQCFKIHINNNSFNKGWRECYSLNLIV
jgi:hypothetical protein